MAEIIWVPGQGFEFPEDQIPEMSEVLVKTAKVGDIAHLIPKGVKGHYLAEHLGMRQIHGCVEERTESGIVLWSTYYASNPSAFGKPEQRTFYPDDVEIILLDRAEDYIPKASQGRFTYGSRANVSSPRISENRTVEVDSYFNGIMSGCLVGKPKTFENRITCGANYFTPIV